MSEFPLFLAWPLLALFIALPAAAAWRRRRASCEVSAVAVELSAFATASRASATPIPMDDVLRLRLMRLRVAEAVALQLVLERGGSMAIADAAQRLATRMRRRVAFERKMLARTAPGLRRGAVAACLPPLAMLLLHVIGWDVPAGAQIMLLLAIALGCALLWRVARVEI